MNQVVRETAVADHLRGFEFAPGIGHVQRMLAQHRAREFDAEVLPAEGGHTGKLQGRCAELAEAPLDHLADTLRGRQFGGPRRECRRALVEQRDQRLQYEQRVAAGVAQQRLGPALRFQARHCE